MIEKDVNNKKIRKAQRIYEKFKLENREQFDELNEQAKSWFLDPQNIDCISKAITMYIFREGPAEDVHSECRDLTDVDMKEINIYMVNHLAGLLSYALEGNWMQLRTLAAFFSIYGNSWNPAEPETSGIDSLFYQQFK